MTLVTFITLLVSATALLFAIGAFVVAFHSLRQSRSTSASKQSVRLTEIESTIEELSVALRNLRSRLNMQSARAKARASTEPTESAPPEDDKAATRAHLNGLLAEKLGRS